MPVNLGLPTRLKHRIFPGRGTGLPAPLVAISLCVCRLAKSILPPDDCQYGGAPGESSELLDNSALSRRTTDSREKRQRSGSLKPGWPMASSRGPERSGWGLRAPVATKQPPTMKTSTERTSRLHCEALVKALALA